MKANSPYDCKEQSNVAAWKMLPPCCQHFIRTIQARIQEEIETRNAGQFKPTSGFRSEATNRKYGGATESLHRLGMARDFIPINGFSTYPLPPVVDNSRFSVIRCPNCWHVEVII